MCFLTAISASSIQTMETTISNPGLAPSLPVRAYSAAECEQKRPFITRLYRDEEKSLDYVRAILAQQAFRPT
jgi:hypothetical protein